MAKEILAVPEEHLKEVIQVIRAGITTTPNLSEEVAEQLQKWCNDEARYIADSEVGD